MTGLPVTTFFLIRHTEPAEWAKGLCHGTLDVPLSEDGEIHARRIGDHLGEMRLDAVYSSPLSRAVATASAVASPHGLEPMLREDLREIDFGQFEGRTFDEIAASHPDLYAQVDARADERAVPGGRGFRRPQRRARRVRSRGSVGSTKEAPSPS